jgi:hypothetical protein
MPSVTVGVFVSSTWLDLQPERGAVKCAIHRMRETQFIGMEYFGSRDEATRRASLDEVDRSDVYVGIIGGRYGSGITEAEYDRAYAHGLPCFIYFKSRATAPLEQPGDAPDGAQKLEDFKTKLRRHTVTAFNDSGDLATKVATDLHNWLADQYLPLRLERALRGETSAEQAGALLRAIHNPGLLKGGLAQRLHQAGFRVFIGDYERLRDAYIEPWPVFERVDVEHFFGREWLTARLDAFLNENDRGYFVLEAAAGVGKTAFLAHLVRERGYIHHFVELAGGSDGPDHALKNLAAQIVLACELAPYTAEEVLPPASGQPTFLLHLLKRASEKLAQRSTNEKLVLVVDGLDQADPPSQQNVLGLPESLPAGIYFVVSQRPVRVNLDTGTTPRLVEHIRAGADENLGDLRAWLEQAVTREPICSAMRPGSEADFIAAMLAKSGGLWIYVHYMCAEIECGDGPLALHRLPQGLWQYYARFWQRWRDTHSADWDGSDLHLLAVLAALQRAQRRLASARKHGPRVRSRQCVVCSTSTGARSSPFRRARKRAIDCITPACAIFWKAYAILRIHPTTKSSLLPKCGVPPGTPTGASLTITWISGGAWRRVSPLCRMRPSAMPTLGTGGAISSHTSKKQAASGASTACYVCSGHTRVRIPKTSGMPSRKHAIAHHSSLRMSRAPGACARQAATSAVRFATP